MQWQCRGAMDIKPESILGSTYDRCASAISAVLELQGHDSAMQKLAPNSKNSRRLSRIANVLEDRFGRPAKPRRRSSPLNALIATLLSQNTNDRNSYRAWLRLRRRFPTWGRVARASWQSIAKAIEVGGLKNQKARRIKKILQSVHQERGSYDLGFLKVKRNDEIMEYLLSMKGVGNKTAACVLVFSLGRDVFPVDTHIHRICNRLGLVRTKSADQTYEAMAPILRDGRAYSFHVNLIRFGREVCRSNKPLCGICPLFDECIYPAKESLALQGTKGTRISGERSSFLITREIEKDRTK
jgi:endonuclease-3